MEYYTLLIPEDSTVRIPLDVALLEPEPLATLHDGQKLAFMASNYAIGGTNKLDLQLLLQEV